MTTNKPDIYRLFERHDEQLANMGEHLSHMRKDMNTMSSIQQTDIVESKARDVESKLFRESVTKSFEELKPVLNAFTKKANAREVLFQDGKIVILWAAGITSVGAAISYLYQIIMKLARPL